MTERILPHAEEFDDWGKAKNNAIFGSGSHLNRGIEPTTGNPFDEVYFRQLELLQRLKGGVVLDTTAGRMITVPGATGHHTLPTTYTASVVLVDLSTWSVAAPDPVLPETEATITRLADSAELRTGLRSIVDFVYVGPEYPNTLDDE